MNEPKLRSAAEDAARQLGLSIEKFCAPGAFKETYLTSNAGEYFALKVLDCSKCDEVREQREIEALKRCNSPRIARFHKHITIQHNGGRYGIVLEEFLDGGTLEEKLRSSLLDRTGTLTLINGLLEAVSVLKGLRLVHRDIKPANIMFRKADPHPVLVDFGLVRDLSETSATMSWLPRGPGTPAFASPEQLNNDKSIISWHSDQFSVAIVASYAFFGKHPYQEDDSGLIGAVQAVAARRPLPAWFIQVTSDSKLEFLVRMLQAWPVLRFNRLSDITSELS